MDRLDVGVLRELMVDDNKLTINSDVRRPYLAIARKLHVTEDTIRNRILKMRDRGLIRGWRLGVNPTLFGYQAEFVWVDINLPSTKESVIQAVRRNPHAILIQNYFGDSIGIGLAYASREVVDKEIGEIGDLANSRDSVAFKTPPMPCRLQLTNTDWRLVKAIRRDPRKPFRKVASELGLSRRTAERRVQRMIGAGALFVLPELDLRELEGGILASLDLYYQQAFKREIDRQVVARYGELLLMTHSTMPERGWFAFVVPSLAVAHEIRLWASGLPGVKEVNLRLIEEYINLLGGAFEKELQTAPSALPSS